MTITPRGKVWVVSAVGLAAALTAGAGAMYRASQPATVRPDCPGRIICPLSGELVCRDRCPLDAAQAPTPAPPACCAHRPAADN